MTLRCLALSRGPWPPPSPASRATQCHFCSQAGVRAAMAAGLLPPCGGGLRRGVALNLESSGALFLPNVRSARPPILSFPHKSLRPGARKRGPGGGRDANRRPSDSRQRFVNSEASRARRARLFHASGRRRRPAIAGRMWAWRGPTFAPGANMVRLNVIYTRTGDKGESGLGDGTPQVQDRRALRRDGRRRRDQLRLGLARLHTAGGDDPGLAEIEATLARVQNDLFDLGADLCLPQAEGEAPGAALRVAASQVEALERAIDTMNEKLAPLRSFILPGGTPAAAALHSARRLPARRAQRRRARRNRRRSGRAPRPSPISTACRTICSSRPAPPTISARGRRAVGAGREPVEKRMSDAGLSTAVGVISGTSMDGIDVALIDERRRGAGRDRALRRLSLSGGRGATAARGRGRPGARPPPRSRSSNAR